MEADSRRAEVTRSTHAGAGTKPVSLQVGSRGSFPQA